MNDAIKTVPGTVTGLALILAFGPAHAHHGVGGQFDLSVEYEVGGVVTDIGWVNPHAYVYFDVTDEDGNVENWRCEMRAAGVLERSGWSAAMFANGTQIEIYGSPARREENTCYIQTIAFNGGEALYRYAQLSEDEAEINEPDGIIPARLANGRPNISGDWAADQRLLAYETVIQRNLGPRRPGGMGRGNANVELTAAGSAMAAQTATAAQAPTDEAGLLLQTGSGSLNCEPRSFIGDWTFDQHPNRIIQHGETITLRYGFMDTVRTIHLTGERPADIEPSLAGYSTGRWEGDVLVVDTTDFSTSESFGSAAGDVVRSDQYRVVERFTLDAENQTLTRAWIAEDPLYWADSISGQDVIGRSETAWQRYGCDDRTNENVIN